MAAEVGMTVGPAATPAVAAATIGRNRQSMTS
jgi:hypothetical protein